MNQPPLCIFLDTNIYIIGAAVEGSTEAKILTWAGFGNNEAEISKRSEVILSEALIEQITHVARRLRNKDWAGEILSEIWHSMNIRFVVLDPDEVLRLESQGEIPREDVTMYLSAKAGDADCFVSANYKLVRALAERTGEFLCFTPEEFISKISDSFSRSS